MSLFLFKKRYLGDLGTWPPKTHYRCLDIEGCNYNMIIPPTSIEGTWTAAKSFGKEPIPVITSDACFHSKIDTLEKDL